VEQNSVLLKFISARVVTLVEFLFLICVCVPPAADARRYELQNIFISQFADSEAKQ
jgi:hypothetical protein